MAEKKGRGAKSASPNTIEAAKIGRMIGALQGIWSEKMDYTPSRPHRHRYTFRYKNKRIFPDTEIMAALGITKEQFDLCLHAWHMAPPRHWTVTTARDAFNAFVKKHKRWPREADYKNWRETGLPSRSSLQIWCSGEWALIERYAQTRSLTPAMILSIPNITVRRNAITRYGIERLILNGGGEKIQQDKFGILWRLPSDGVDSEMLYVEVVNKTPRMDDEGAYVKDKKGEFVYDHYFLRVPPGTTTAKAAVAWTFSIDSRDFAGFAAES